MIVLCCGHQIQESSSTGRRRSKADFYIIAFPWRRTGTYLCVNTGPEDVSMAPVPFASAPWMRSPALGCLRVRQARGNKWAPPTYASRRLFRVAASLFFSKRIPVGAGALSQRCSESVLTVMAYQRDPRPNPPHPVFLPFRETLRFGLIRNAQ